jgi:hypothetical protein
MPYMSASLPIEYYTKKYGEDTTGAFIHLIREIGQVAFAVETKNAPVLEAKLTEAAALIQFIAYNHKIDLESNTEVMYSKKLSLNHRRHEQ